MKFLTHNTGFVSDNKLKDYLPPEDYFKEGLYMFDMGQNDLEGEFYFRSEDQVDQVLAFIPSLLAQVENGFQVESVLLKHV